MISVLWKSILQSNPVKYMAIAGAVSTVLLVILNSYCDAKTDKALSDYRADQLQKVAEEYESRIKSITAEFEERLKAAQSRVKIQTEIIERVEYVDREVEKLVVIDQCEPIVADVVSLLVEATNTVR